MKYKLTVKPMVESEMSRECPFPPEKEDFEPYLIAMVEDLNNLNEVTNATIWNLDSGDIIIETNNSITEKQLCDAMKPIFSSFICKIRYKSLKTIN